MTTAEKPKTLANEKVNARVISLAERLRGETTYAGDGRFTAESDWFVNSLDGNLTKELYNEFSDFKTDAMAAITLVHGELSTDEMVKDKELKSTRLDVPAVSKDYFASKHTRSQTIGTSVHHGITQMTYEVYGSKSHGQNQMQIVKDIISDRAREVLANL